MKKSKHKEIGQDEHIGEYEDRVTKKFIFYIGVPVFVVVCGNYLLDLLYNLDHMERFIPFTQRIVIFSFILLLYYLIIRVGLQPVTETYS